MKACYSDHPSEQNLPFHFKESSYPTVSSYWPSEFTSASSQGHVLNRLTYLMTNLGQFCPMLYSINGQSLSWNSPSSWLRRYQLNIRFQGLVFLVPCPRHLPFTRSESWLDLSQPFLPWPKLPLNWPLVTRSPCHWALSLGLLRTSCFIPPFWQTDVSKCDGMSLLRLGHQRLTMGLLAHHCTCSHLLTLIIVAVIV